MGESCCGIQGPTKVIGSKWAKLFMFLVILFGCLNCALAWEGDLWYFTSFKNVSEWAELYPACDIKTSYKDMGIPDEKIPFTLSPISLPKPEAAIQFNKNDEDEARVLMFYNNPPPTTNSYIVSFGFQKNKECIVQSKFSPCIVSPTFGKIRAVTVTAVREPISHHKKTFSLEPPEKFVTLINGGSENERKFYEAIFLGNVEGSDGYRSTHVVDGKSYPMEIYMFFVDEVLEVMSSATILVVLVEEQEEDNHQVRPIVNAVSNHLYKAERKYLKKNHDIVQREQMYHHLKESKFMFKDNPQDPPPTVLDITTKTYQPKVYQVPSSESIERNEALIREKMELFQAVRSDVLFLKENYERVFSFQTRFTDYIEKYLGKIPSVLQCPYVKLYPYGNGVIGDANLYCSEYLLYTVWFNYFASDLLEVPDVPLDNNINSLTKYPSYYAVAYYKDVFTAMKEYMDNLKELKEHQFSDPNNPTLDMILAIRKLQEKAQKSLDKLNDESDKFTIATLTSIGFQKRNFNPKVVDYHLMYTLLEPLIRTIETKEDLTLKIEDDITPYGFDKDWKSLFGVDTYDPSSSPIVKAEQSLNQYYDYKERFNDHDLKKRKFKRTGEMKNGENLGLTDEEYEEYENLNPLNESLRNRFQISWLLPKGGGYYYYKGSSPVPPCYQAQNVIVFKKPIKMSKEQIKSLTTMPTNFAQTRKIKNTLGRIHPLRRQNFPIHFDKRNHQFLRDDTFHKNSIFEAERRRKEAAEKAKAHSIRITSPNAMTLLLFVLCTIKL